MRTACLLTASSIALGAVSGCAGTSPHTQPNTGNVQARLDASQCTIAGLDLALRGLTYTPGVAGQLGSAATVTGPSAADYGLDCMKRLGYQCTDAGACNGHGASVSMSAYFGF